MKARRICTVFLALVLALSCFSAGGAVVYKTQAVRENSFAFAVDGSNVWLIDQDGLWLSRKGIDFQLIYTCEDVRKIDAYEGAGYLVYGDENRILAKIDESGALQQEWILPFEEEIISFRVYGESALFSMGEQGAGDLLLYTLSSGSAQELELDAAGPVSRGNAGEYLVGQMEWGEIWRVNAQTGECSRIEMQSQVYPMTQCITQEGVRALTYREDEVDIVDISKSGEVVTIGSIPPQGVWLGAALTDEYIYLRADNKLVRYEIEQFLQAAAVKKTELTVAYDWSVFQNREAVRMFEKMHPDTVVRFKEVDPESFTLSLMAGQNEYAMYAGFGEVISQYDYFGLVEDLGQYPQIMQSLQDWHEVGAMYTYDGRIMMIPYGSVGYQWFLPTNGEQFAQMGINLDGMQTPTYEEFAEMAQTARDNGVWLFGDDDSPNFLFYDYLAKHPDYLTDGRHFDTEDFRVMMQTWKEWFDSGLMLLVPWDEKYTVRPDDMGLVLRDDILLVDNGYGFGYELNDFSGYMIENNYVGIPDAQGSGIISSDMIGVCIFSNSAQKELAADFLACFASAETMDEYEGRDEAQWMYLKDLSMYTFIGSNPDGQLTPEQFERVKQMHQRTRCAPNIFDITNELVGVDIPQYLRGEITLDELVERANERTERWING